MGIYKKRAGTGWQIGTKLINLIGKSGDYNSDNFILGRRIIIVEDDADDRFLMKTAFSENGFDDSLLYLENGYELLRFLDGEKTMYPQGWMPGLILMDLNMPKLNGREVLQEIQKEGYWAHLPIVIFSTTQNENEKKKCLELGALAYYTKPVTFAGLISTVAQIRNTHYE